MAVKRYIPTIGLPDWNIKEMSKEERIELKRRLVISQVTTHEEYQKVITYLYKKFPFEMDGVKIQKDQLLAGQVEGQMETAIQWNYRAGKNGVYVKNHVTGQDQNMYAFIVYDSDRDMEPVAFAGSYFVIGNKVIDDDLNKQYLVDGYGKFDLNGKYQLAGQGIVMFVDPAYRRLGLGTDLWLAEAELYRSALKIRYQRDIQNSYSVESTKAMYDDPSKCLITYEGKLKADGTRAGIRVLLDYTDQSLQRGFDDMLAGLRAIHNQADWRWVEREKFTDEEYQRIWKAGKLV